MTTLHRTLFIFMSASLMIALSGCFSTILDEDSNPSEKKPDEVWDPGDKPNTGTHGSGGYGSGSMHNNTNNTTPPRKCDEVTFSYEGLAQTVWVTGSFNNWAMNPEDGALELDQVDGVWTRTESSFAKGQHHYKFIIDGDTWISDPQNPQTINDHYLGTNSVLTVCDTQPTPPCGTVHLTYVNPEATLVKLAGSFTQWADGALDMIKLKDTWHIIIHLDPGDHSYKLIVDDEWVVDPKNPALVDNGLGGQNSLLRILCSESGSCGDVDTFDWRDAVLYFAMVDRFHNANTSNDSPIPGVTGDNGNGASGQYEGGDLEGVTQKIPTLPTSESPRSGSPLPLKTETAGAPPPIRTPILRSIPPTMATGQALTISTTPIQTTPRPARA